MKTETLKITMYQGERAFLCEVKGQRIMIDDLPCFIHESSEETLQGTVFGWTVSHLETGFCVASDLSKKHAIKKATEMYKRNKKNSENTLKSGRQTCRDAGIELPVNK